MPSVSNKQIIAMAIAEHEPDKLSSKNKGLKKMTHQQLHEFASRVDKSKKLKGKKRKQSPYANELGKKAK